MTPKILIGVCSGESLKAETMLCLFQLLGTTKQNAIFSLQIGGYKPFNMNRLVQAARDNGATHILNIDSDMMFEPDVLDRLLKHDKAIVGVNYRARGTKEDQDYPYSTVKFGRIEEYEERKPEDFPTKLFNCSAVGLGICLMKMTIFDKLPKPYFYTKEKDILVTEDIVFCQDAQKAGFKVWCDPEIPVKHIGSYHY